MDAARPINAQPPVARRESDLPHNGRGAPSTARPRRDRSGERVGETVVEEHPELRLAIGDHALPSECDAAIVQDAIVSYAHAARYPNAPQIFVAHSTLHDHQLPAQLPGICRSVVALNERVARRLRALGGDVEVVRLRQPVDLDVFTPLVPLVIRPSRVRIPPSSADSSESPAQSGLFVGLHTRRAFGSVTHQTCGWREIAVCGASSRSQVDRTLRPFGGVASSRHRTAYESRGSAHDLAGVRRVR